MFSASTARAAALPLAALPLATLLATGAAAQSAPPGNDTEATRQATNLGSIKVTAPVAHTQSPKFPASQVSIPAEQVEATINAIDVEDAAKYLPSVFIRKRNYGDTQPVLATRTWGLNSSARTLVYIDDIPISALIANNNTIGAPRWGMVSPEQIDHVDMLYGPFSAAYAGNSMGGVMQTSTRTPEKTELSIRQTEAVQDYDQYGTHDHFSTSQTSLTVGGRDGRLGWFLGANLQNSFSQPLSYLTAAAPPAGTSGSIPASNKLGQTADVVGAGGLLHTRMLNLNGMFTYDLTPSLRATYLVGFWSNDGQSRAQSYLTGANGQPTYGKVAGFASNIYQLEAHHLMQALSLKTDTRGDFDGALVLTHYDFIKDQQLNPAAVTAGTGLSSNGRLASYAGTNWSTLDLKGIWRPDGYDGNQEVSAGAHADQYVLKNPTNNTQVWQDADSLGSLYAAGRGKTQTQALWLQDAWRFAPAWLATLGGRYEWWQASDGYNYTSLSSGGGIGVAQPKERADGFSPKLSVQWDFAPNWQLTGSLAKAVRFPTVGELYQLVATGPTYSTPNPDLKPETAHSGELALEHQLERSSVRLSLFQENTWNALIAQTAFLSSYPVPVSYTMNVGKLRNRGLELAAQQRDVLIDGLDLAGSVTYVDSTILSNDGFVSTANTTSDGKRAPYVPRWRATAVITYRPDSAWAFTLAGRYSSRQYSTLDNTDNTGHVFGAFDGYTVFDARAHYQINEQWSASFGVDNFTNEKYFLYHPFPQRTYVADLKFTL